MNMIKVFSLGGMLMGMVFSILKKYRVAAIAALVMMLIELTVELIQPLLISKIIDDGIQKQDLSVVWMGSRLTGSAIIAFIAGYPALFAAHTSQGLGYDLRDQLYEKVQSFSYSIFNRFATSSLITRLTGDVTQIQDTVFMGLRFMTRVPLVVLGSIIMALVVNVKLGFCLSLPCHYCLFYRLDYEAGSGCVPPCTAATGCGKRRHSGESDRHSVDTRIRAHGSRN